MSNLTDIGKETITNLATPSASYTTYEITTTGQTFTAPSNGFFNFGGVTGITTTAFIRLKNTTNSMIVETSGYGGAGAVPYVILPVKKGDVVAVTFNITGTLWLYFYPFGD